MKEKSKDDKKIKKARIYLDESTLKIFNENGETIYGCVGDVFTSNECACEYISAGLVNEGYCRGNIVIEDKPDFFDEEKWLPKKPLNEVFRTIGDKIYAFGNTGPIFRYEGRPKSCIIYTSSGSGTDIESVMEKIEKQKELLKLLNEDLTQSFKADLDTKLSDYSFLKSTLEELFS